MLPVGVFAREDIHLIFCDLYSQSVLQDLDFFKHIFGVGSHNRPLVGGGIVHLDNFVDVVELVEPTDLEDVPVPERAHSWLA